MEQNRREESLTIREKALQYGGYEDCAEFCAFLDGAEWMLERASDWLGDNVSVDSKGRTLDIEAFRSAMGYYDE